MVARDDSGRPRGPTLRPSPPSVDAMGGADHSSRSICRRDVRRAADQSQPGESGESEVATRARRQVPPDAASVVIPRRAWRALAVGCAAFSLVSFNTTATNLAFGDISETFS